METSVKTTKKQEKEDVAEATEAVVADEEEEEEEEERASNEIAITVHARDQQWTFHCDEDQPLANTLFIPLENFVGGKCILHYDTTTAGNQILDRTKTPSFYGMIYDDVIYLGGIITPVSR